MSDGQVGGTHYQATIQVWDFVAENGIPFMEGNIVKYVTRAKKKRDNPVQDLEKAQHYLQKLKEFVAKGSAFPRGGFLNSVKISARKFTESNGLGARQEQVIRLVAFWRSTQDLTHAEDLLAQWIADEIAHPCPACEGDGYVGPIFGMSNCDTCKGSGKRPL